MQAGRGEGINLRVSFLRVILTAGVKITKPQLFREKPPPRPAIMISARTAQRRTKAVPGLRREEPSGPAPSLPAGRGAGAQRGVREGSASAGRGGCCYACCPYQVWCDFDVSFSLSWGLTPL